MLLQRFSFKRWGIFALSASAAFGGVSLAQGVAPLEGNGHLGFAEVYDLALQNDATLRAARAQTAGVAERVAQAKAQLLPNVSLTANRYKNDISRTQANLFGQTSTTDESYYSQGQSLVLRQPLYRPALTWGVSQAQAQVNDAEALLARETQMLGVRVAEAYLQVLATQEREALLVGQAALIERQLDSASRRFQAGQGIRTDIDEAKARLDMVQAQQLEVAQTRQGALLQLQMMVQTSVQSVRSLAPNAPNAEIFDAKTALYWTERAEAQSPELASLRARVLAAKLDVERAKSGHKPTLDLIAQVSRSASENVTSPRSGYTNRQLGLQLTVPLYAGGGTQSFVRQALAEQNRQDELLESVRRDLQIKVQKEWRGVVEGQRRMVALARAVASTAQVVVSIRRSFEGGLRTALDVLNAEQQALQARIDLNEARLGYVVARFRLLALVGELGADTVTEADGWFLPV